MIIIIIVINNIISRVFEDRDKLLEGALELASLISSKSPVAVQSTKMALIHARDHSVDESLSYMVSVRLLWSYPIGVILVFM